jgi:hypothetical protein
MNKAKHKLAFNDVSGLAFLNACPRAKGADREGALPVGRFVPSDSLIPACCCCQTLRLNNGACLVV